jgi:hypothetical protein
MPRRTNAKYLVRFSQKHLLPAKLYQDGKGAGHLVLGGTWRKGGDSPDRKLDQDFLLTNTFANDEM